MPARFNFRKPDSFGSLFSKASNRKALIKNPVALSLGLLAVALVIISFAMSARSWFASSQAFHSSSSAGSTNGAPAAQATPLQRGKLHSLLSLQPEANRLRRRIGKRFLSAGREVSILAGALTIGNSRHSVSIIRTQNADGESLAISIDGNPRPLTWDDKDGAKDEGGQAAGERRALIERIALDSADQFILAQARGAIYETIAQQVRPSEAGGKEGYAGPVWDLVRIAEPSSPNPKKPLSHWRLYYINSVTGLIEKVISQEGGQRIISEVSGWVDQGGEKFPTRYVWKLNNQELITLSLTSVTFNAKQ